MAASGGKKYRQASNETLTHIRSSPPVESLHWEARGSTAVGFSPSVRSSRGQLEDRFVGCDEPGGHGWVGYPLQDRSLEYLDQIHQGVLSSTMTAFVLPTPPPRAP